MPGAKAPPKNDLDALGKALAEAAKARTDLEVQDLEKRRLAASETRTQLEEPVTASKVILYCGVNCVLSAALIAFNKHLMHPARFPFPLPLVALHSTSSTVFVVLFLLIHRVFFSSDSSASGFFSALPQVNSKGSLKFKVLGLASLTAVQLVFSNMSFLYSSVTFIQMLKECNLVIVYILSVCAALEIVNWQRARVLACIIFATMLTVKGEVHFSWRGFAIQGTGQFFEGCRIVLQACVLTGAGMNLDILTYLLLVMPACAVLLNGFLFVNTYVYQGVIVDVPSWSELQDWWPQLLVNGFLAACLNFFTALVVKHCSAVGLVLSGITKDSMILAAGAYLLGETVTGMQAFGFLMQLTGIFIYSIMKLYPNEFDGGFHIGFKQLISKVCVAREALPRKQQPGRAYGATNGKI